MELAMYGFGGHMSRNEAVLHESIKYYKPVSFSSESVRSGFV